MAQLIMPLCRRVGAARRWLWSPSGQASSLCPSLLCVHTGLSVWRGMWASSALLMAPGTCVLQLSQGCSLHLAQRLSQLLNLQLRRMPVLSKESAPGLIVATGKFAVPALSSWVSRLLRCSQVHRDRHHLLLSLLPAGLRNSQLLDPAENF